MEWTSRLNIFLSFYHTIRHIEQLIVEAAAVQYLIQMVTVGVGYENLSESVIRYKSDNLSDTVGV